MRVETIQQNRCRVARENFEIRQGVECQRTASNQPSFGHVIKTRFFEVLPDASKAQIQDAQTVKSLTTRLKYHLSCLHRQKNDRIGEVSQFLSKVDSDYAFEPTLRRIYNFNRPYDSCVYLITGKDAVSLDNFARTSSAPNKKSELIEQHWKLVRNQQRRLQDKDGQELALNVFLRKGKNSKTGEDGYFFKGLGLVFEKYMYFPYRMRGANLE